MPDPDAGLPNLCKRNSGAFVFYEHNLNLPKTDMLLLTISDITMQHHDISNHRQLNFTWQVVQANTQENIKALHPGLCEGNPQVDLLTKGQ